MAMCWWRSKPISQKSIIVFEVFAAAGIVLAIVGAFWWAIRRVRIAEEWPMTEATIEGGTFQTVPSTRDHRDPLKAPVLYFSYQVGGEYFSGRVALLDFFDDSGEEIIRRMTLQKLQIHYDPKDSTRWLIDGKIAGYKIGQEGLEPQANRRL
jgi:hypothetical protein